MSARRLTARDETWIAWMARWRFVTAPLIVREFTTRGAPVLREAVDRRMSALRELGVVELRRELAEVPRLCWLTREGMALAGVGGAAPKPRLSDVRHDLAVLDVAHWLATVRVPSHTLVTEREIRRTEAPTSRGARTAHYSLDLPERDTHTRAYPDLVSVAPTGHAFGHEIEHSRKDVRRLVRLMLAYASCPTYAGAIYYVTGHAGDNVHQAATRANDITAERYGRRPITVHPWPITDDAPTDVQHPQTRTHEPR